MQFRRFAKAIAGSVRRDRSFTLEDYMCYQRRLLAELLDWAHTHVPFHRDRWSAPRTRDFRFESVPPTCKQEMMANFDLTIADGCLTRADIDRQMASSVHALPVLNGKYLITTTSGTSGIPGIFVNSMDDWAQIRGMVSARVLRDKLNRRLLARFLIRRLKVGFLLTSHRYSISWQSAETSRLRSKLFARIEIFPIERAVQDNIEGLNRLNPFWLHAYPTALEEIAHCKLRGDDVRFQPHVISLGSESTSAAARQAISSAFPGSLISIQYGSTECAVLANSCAAGRLHLNPDCAIVEPMNEHGQPVPPGKYSDHILVTNLISRLQPIIRYRIDDSICVDSAPCLCGRPTPTITIEGRRSSHFYLLDNHGRYRRLSALRVLTGVLDVAGLAAIQVVHLRQNEIEFRVAPVNSSETERVLNIAHESMRLLLTDFECNESVTVRVVPVERIERTGSGQKMTQVHSLVEAPQGFTFHD